MPLDHIDLREMKKSGDVEGLLSILDTGDVKEIREAIRVLGELRNRKAVRSLIGLLEKDDIQIRANSAWALGEIGNAKAVLPLIGLLNDPSENVRIYAAWALGRIGDKRAITALNAALKNGSSDLRKHAKEAIARIESNKRNIQQEDDDNYSVAEDELLSSELIDIPLVTLDVPQDMFECNYVSKVEGASKKGSTMRFSGDVTINDTVNANQENTRRIFLGLKNDFSGLVSIDVLFKYTDSKDGENTSSVWLQMTTVKNEPIPYEWEPEEQIEEPIRRVPHQSIKKTRIKSAKKQIPRHVEYDIQEYPEPENEIKKTNVDIQPSFEETVKPVKVEPVQEIKTQVSPQPSTEKAGASVDSAVRLLSDIGMTGMTEAASTVTQLGGQEAESLQSRLRTLPVDQIPDEIVNLGDYIVSIEVKLHGKSQSGEMKGEMQLYFSKNVALDIANELLCNQPDAAIKEFTEDIISTLKEASNIFGGQYVSAISEYIEIPIMLEAPAFKTGTSLQIAESVMKDITGKVDFALATDLAFGGGKTGRLIMLLDPKSYDIIITKLF